MTRREYKTGTRWCIWRWKDIHWRGELYLRRLHVFQCPLFSILIHWIMQPDKQEHLHDHPVDMLSIVLRGWYVEETDRFYVGDDCYAIISRIRAWWNWIPATKQHRIAYISGGCITLCICGPRKREWGFWTSEGWIPWQEYHRRYGGGTT